MKEYFVYIHLEKLTGEIFYIGKGTCTKKRGLKGKCARAYLYFDYCRSKSWVKKYKSIDKKNRNSSIKNIRKQRRSRVFRDIVNKILW